MLKKLSVLLLIVSVCVGAVHGLGLSNVNFDEVDQGETYTETIVLINSPQDFDNHFVIEVDGEMKDWITVSPVEFDLPKASEKPLTITLTVPKDAPLGAVTATITALGKETAPSAGETSEGAVVGYAVATKSNVLANVIKPGATAAIEITRVEIPKNNQLGDDVKFTITAKNIGNVPAIAHFSVAISNGEQVITTIPSVPTEFELNAEKIIKLYWDTAGQSEGMYTALVSVTPSSEGKDARIKTASYPAITIELGRATEYQTVFIAIGGTLIALAVVIAIVVRKRRKEV